MYQVKIRAFVVGLLVVAISVAAVAQQKNSPGHQNRREVVLAAANGKRLKITAPVVLKKQGREHPPAVIRAAADAGQAGKLIELKRAEEVVARGTLGRKDEGSAVELSVPAFPSCITPDELEVFVEGVSVGHFRAPLALVGMRGNPPLAEVLDALSASDDEFFPLVDRLGQYRHRDWPGKTTNESDFHAAQAAEARDLAARPGPAAWNQYGGWEAGPQLTATGFFRVEKLRGKWWLVDPAGRLFWSHGADCVRASSGATPISHREHYFADLPQQGDPLSEFYSWANWAPHGFYHNRGRYRMFNFTAANLHRKYGVTWRERYAELSHRRLRSWGMNTIGNWSDPEIYGQRRTPYVATISAHSRPIEGSEGYWGKFPDPFDDSLREAVRRGMAAQKGKAARDPWCIGFFVHNELAWGKDASLGRAALASPATQPAKVALMDHLPRKYDTIEALNRAWGTKFASFDALATSEQLPSGEAIDRDLAEFSGVIADRYFRVCREEVKRAAPDQLYLGCRFAWVNDRAVHAAAGHCDVIGYNRYRYTVADFQLPDGIDKPVIIGEFHFGALDRGMLHPGLRPVKDQNARAAAYKEYVFSALDHPQLVGTHWFLYGSQPTTGRGDGENYQIGLLDICDTPYHETIAACREVGYDMYPRRGGTAAEE